MVSKLSFQILLSVWYTNCGGLCQFKSNCTCIVRTMYGLGAGVGWVRGRGENDKSSWQDNQEVNWCPIRVNDLSLGSFSQKPLGFVYPVRCTLTSNIRFPFLYSKCCDFFLFKEKLLVIMSNVIYSSLSTIPKILILFKFVDFNFSS